MEAFDQMKRILARPRDLVMFPEMTRFGQENRRILNQVNLTRN